MRRLWIKGVTVIIAFVLIGAFGLTGCAPKQPVDLSGSFTITGSDSEVNLVQSLVEEYAKVNDTAEFSVTGGGSGVGISAIINSTADIANSSRPMSEDEIAQARAKSIEPVPIVFAFDGVAVVVHKDNSVKELTMEQVGKIYRGEITNWSEIGGPNIAITLFGRQPTSGTFVFFRSLVVKGDYAASMNQMSGTSAIIEGVAQDLGGIGYAAIGYVKGATGVAPLSIATEAGAEFISPLNDEKVFGGEYALTRPLYQYVNGKPTGALKDFFLFELSEEGQAIIVAEGFLPVTPEYVQKNNEYLQ